MRLIAQILGQPQTPSLALPQNLRKATTAPPQILESFFYKNAFLSLRGSEATEAKQGEAEASLVIHNKKVDSSMDRHADKSLAMTESGSSTTP